MLRDLDLRIGYDRDDDDIIQDFFLPCISNCTKFSESINLFSLDALKATLDLFEGSVPDALRIEIVAGNRFAIRDFNTLSNILHNHRKHPARAKKGGHVAEEMLEDGRITVRVAVSNVDEEADHIVEQMGIFEDERGDMVMYSGVVSKSFFHSKRDFELVDVFTSWGDPARVRHKAGHFGSLWENRARRFGVCDFVQAAKRGLIRYSTEWVMHN